MEFERAYAAAGGLLMAGSDPTGDGGTLAGYGDQEEIELLVRAGFSPVEAIHIASANGAEFLGQSARIGTIAQGQAGGSGDDRRRSCGADCGYSQGGDCFPKGSWLQFGKIVWSGARARGGAVTRGDFSRGVLTASH